jgi:hypothetical protein
MMAKYTTTIKTLIDHNFDFGLNNYPIFDENYRDTLNHNILYHFYENEIGFETANLFKLYLNQKLNEIMPKYNEMYKAQKIILTNLTGNVNLTETLKRDTSSNTNASSNSLNNGKNTFLDTPQGDEYKGEMEDTNYATTVSFNRNNINDTSSMQGTGVENYIKTIIGNNGNKYNIDILYDIQNKLVNIDLLIINELNDLFMQIY